MMGEDGIWVDPLNVFSTEGFIKAVESGNVAFALGPRAFLRKPTADVAVLVYDLKVGFGQTPKAEWPWLISSVFVNRGGQWVGVSRSEVRGNRPSRRPLPRACKSLGFLASARSAVSAVKAFVHGSLAQVSDIQACYHRHHMLGTLGVPGRRGFSGRQKPCAFTETC